MWNFSFMAQEINTAFSQLSVLKIKQQKRIIKKALQNSYYPANEDLTHCPKDMVDLHSVRSFTTSPFASPQLLLPERKLIVPSKKQLSCLPTESKAL